MNGMLKKVVGMSMAVVMAATVTVLPAKLPGIKAIAQPQCPVTVLDAVPAGQWQDEVNFPDWANYVDDTLIMNSLYSFTGFADQGSVYVTASEGITGMELFINGTRVDASSILENPGKAVQMDYAAVAKNGTNTIQVTNITPSNAKVNVKIPYAKVIDGTPAEVGMEEDTLQLIDDLISSEVKYGFSAAQLAVIKDGKMVVNEAWGNVNGWTRDGEMDKTSAPVTTDTLFDLASNTKMYATNYAVQKLVSEGKLNLDAKVRDYIPNFKDGANDKIKGKDNLTIREILQHQAGFPADPQYHRSSTLFCQERDKILEKIIETPLQYTPGSKTVYSDVDYMLLGFIIEEITGDRLDEYLKENIYDPMGLTHTTFNPLQNGFEKDDCAATELQGNTRDGHEDIDYPNMRTETVQGEVHDEKAYYCMEGISGHAGLFSNAEELAKLCQVMINGGGYGTNKFFSKDTIDEFTKPKSSDLANWGLGWWRKADNSTRMYYFGPQSSSNTYGHQGWTGTITVIDPESNLVIVLLTNKKNSPVIDNKVDSNDFVCDNYVLGSLGVVSGYIYEALNTHNPQAADANLATLGMERIKQFKTRIGYYDTAVHMTDTYAIADALVTRAEHRGTEQMKAYAQTMLDELDAIVENSERISDADKELAAGYSEALQARIDALQATSETSDTGKIGVQPVDSVPAGAGSQVTLHYPSQLGSPTLSKLFSTSLFTFKGYENQGTMYVTVKSADAAGLRIFINGAEVDTTEMVANPGKAFAVDFSAVAVNDRNTVQVSGMPISIENGAGVSLQIANPTVQDGDAAALGFNTDVLDAIDTIINNDIANGFSAAQLAIVKDGVLVKNTGYGTVNAYNQDGTPKTDSAPVTTETLFDLASNTKMYATNFAVQKLVTEGKLSIYDKVSKYFPDFKDQPGDPYPYKAQLTIQNILEHQAGFPADPQYHNQNVSGDLFSQDKATTIQMIMKTPLQYQPGTKTVYSDVDYMLLGAIVEKITGQALDTYVENTIYKPMGLDSIVYNPLRKGFDKDSIAATELNGNTRDGAIRFENVRTYTLQGEVHDEKAFYSMDGVSGHAGLFANAADLAKLAQTVLNDGGYGATKVFSKNVSEKFTARKDSSATWGLGWWRQGDCGRPWYFGVQASRGTVGHQGWTGTLTMIDPAEDLVVVYLTNKINSPLINNKVNANMFAGNKYTASTLGFVTNMVYEALNNDNPESLDAMLADMANEKMKLVASAGAKSADEPIVKAAYSLVDTVLDRAEQRQNDSTLAYAENAVRGLDVERDRAQIMACNQRLVALGGDPVELPGTGDELADLQLQVKVSKVLYEKGQQLAEHMWYKQSTWDAFTAAYDAANEVLALGETATGDQLAAAKEALATAQSALQAVDKTYLHDLIVTADEKVADGSVDALIDSVKQAYLAALADAKEVYENKAASIQDTVLAYDELLDQLHNLDFVAGDKTELGAMIRMAEAANLDGYLSDGKQAFIDALADAKEVYEDGDALQADIDKAYQTLFDTFMALVPKADKAMLDALIAKAESLQLDQYVEDGKDALAKALLNAKAVSAYEEAVQQDVDSAAKALSDAMKALRKAASKDNLAAQYAQAESLDLRLYTDGSAQRLKASMETAKALLEDENLDESQQDKVDAAAADLSKAIDQLELKNETQTPVQPSKPGNNTGAGGSTPNTGDSASPLALGALGLAALAGLAAVAVKRRGGRSKQGK